MKLLLFFFCLLFLCLAPRKKKESQKAAHVIGSLEKVLSNLELLSKDHLASLPKETE